jgi:cellobiose transport system substrate-binding protein
VLKRPEVQNLRSPYFNDAPVGKIFAASVLKLAPQRAGPQQGNIEHAATAAIARVEYGKSSAGSAWTQFLRDVDALRVHGTRRSHDAITG